MRDNSTWRLERLTRPLEPVKAPWYVSQPDFRSNTPSNGWWWIPRGAQHPVYLGHNHIVAEVQVRALLDALEKPKPERARARARAKAASA